MVGSTSSTHSQMVSLSLRLQPSPGVPDAVKQHLQLLGASVTQVGQGVRFNSTRGLHDPCWAFEVPCNAVKHAEISRYHDDHKEVLQIALTRAPKIHQAPVLMNCLVQCTLPISWEDVTRTVISRRLPPRNTHGSFVNAWWPLYRLMRCIASAQANVILIRTTPLFAMSSNGCSIFCTQVVLSTNPSGSLTISHVYSCSDVYSDGHACQHGSLIFQLWNGKNTKWIKMEIQKILILNPVFNFSSKIFAMYYTSL